MTKAQMGAIRLAFRNLAEDGSGMERGDPVTKHFGNIERQMRGEYTSAERAAIFDGAKRLLEGSKNENS